MPLATVSSRAPDVSLQGDGDRDVPLSDTWRDRAAVLVFLRHFG